MAIPKRFLCFGVSACSLLLSSYSRHATVKNGPGMSMRDNRVIPDRAPYVGMSASLSTRVEVTVVVH
jgi:hypothetical protein